jgi:RNA polymerase sigma factor (sigma-70 family)
VKPVPHPLLPLVSEVLDTLSDHERLVLSLHYQQELSMAEVAQVMELDEERVCLLRARAMSAVRTAMGSEAGALRVR